MIIGLKDNWTLAEKQHTDYLESVIAAFKASALKGKSKYLKDFVIKVEDWVISSDKSDLDRAAHLLDEMKISLTPAAFTRLKKGLSEIFDYKKFTTKKPNKWDAYHLCALSRFRICPYCHHCYAFTLHRGKDGLLRPTLDHFYPKSDYPHLALTLTNLIPSCYTCNSTLKGDADFKTEAHLHPLFDDESISFRCSIPNGDIVNTVSFLEKQRDLLELEITLPLSQAAQNSVKTFALKERYDALKKEGIDFAISQIQIKELIQNLSVTNGTRLDLDPNVVKARLLRFVPSEYREYLLGKLYLDLSRQFER
jgi:5-methylcytosine-specific restriction endonuclease McrA